MTLGVNSLTPVLSGLVELAPGSNEARKALEGVSASVGVTKNDVHAMGRDASSKRVQELYVRVQEQISSLEAAQEKITPALTKLKEEDLARSHRLVQTLYKKVFGANPLKINPSPETKDMNRRSIELGDAVRQLRSLRDDIQVRQQKMQALASQLVNANIVRSGNSQVLWNMSERSVSYSADFTINGERRVGQEDVQKGLEVFAGEAEDGVNKLLNFASSQACDALRADVATYLAGKDVVSLGTSTFNAVSYKKSGTDVEITAKTKVSLAASAGLPSYATVDATMVTAVKDGKVTTKFMYTNVVPNEVASLEDMRRLARAFPSSKPASILGVLKV